MIVQSLAQAVGQGSQANWTRGLILAARGFFGPGSAPVIAPAFGEPAPRRLTGSTWRKTCQACDPSDQRIDRPLAPP